MIYIVGMSNLVLSNRLNKTNLFIKLKKDLISEVKEMSHLRLSQRLVEDLKWSLELKLSNKKALKYKIDKYCLVLEILEEAFELNEDEKMIVQKQLDYIIEKKIVKELGCLKRFAYDVFFLVSAILRH